MSDIVISARNVSKTYRLHSSPSDRLADVFGLLPTKTDRVKLHKALNDVSFDIARGEKVAIIGRNGAGKSTLLKLITRVTEPTEGRLDVRGETRALLQIGTGFHPDFTGRKNVDAYLANMGVSGARAKQMIEDAVTFAELEDYVDQPVKSYSTGMAMRLMFAASTMLKPDLLVIDEVLGVGDAYFQRKSFERIREMCEGRETTLLLVTHDIYSAATLCDRMIWIDRGRILIDADPPTVIRAYEDAIREQEERRLRLKALKYAADRGEHARSERIVVEIHSNENQPPPCEVWFSRIALLVDGVPAATLRFGEDAFENRDGGQLQKEGANWGDPSVVEGRLARPIRTFGSPFHKVAGVFDVPIDASGLSPERLAVAVDLNAAEAAQLRVSLTSASWRIEMGELPAPTQGWLSHESRVPGQHDAPTVEATTNNQEIGDWATWKVESPELQHSFLDSTLKLAWDGAAGLYLLKSPAVVLQPGETFFIPLTASVQTGTLGVGALNGQGQWLRTFSFAPGIESRTLEFTADKTGQITLVLYGEGPAPLAAELTHGERQLDSAVNTKGVYGTGDVRVDAFRVIDAKGRETPALPVGEAARFEIDYRIVRPGFCERAQVLLAFKRDGVHDVFRVIERGFLFDQESRSEGTICLAFNPLPLAPASYTIVVAVVAEGYYDTRQLLYFSINPGVYFSQATAAEIRVVGTHQVYDGTCVVGQATWLMDNALPERLDHA